MQGEETARIHAHIARSVQMRVGDQPFDTGEPLEEAQDRNARQRMGERLGGRTEILDIRQHPLALIGVVVIGPASTIVR